MTVLTDIPLVKCVLMGDKQADIVNIMQRYAHLNGLDFRPQIGDLFTAYNGQKCVFVDHDTVKNHENDDVHVFLLCVSVASRNVVEESVKMIIQSMGSRVATVPFVLIGTQIEKRIQTSSEVEKSSPPMALSQAEAFAKQIGALKYIECSAATGEGLDEVFEDSFAIGQKFAVARKRFEQRKKSSQEEPCSRKQSCITQ